jgi:hypothetical protein
MHGFFCVNQVLYPSSVHILQPLGSGRPLELPPLLSLRRRWWALVHSFSSIFARPSVRTVEAARQAPVYARTRTVPASGNVGRQRKVLGVASHSLAVRGRTIVNQTTPSITGGPGRCRQRDFIESERAKATLRIRQAGSGLALSLAGARLNNFRGLG